MVSKGDFWESTRETVDDDQWWPFRYDDDAVQFVCSECNASIWQGRSAVEQEHGDYRIQAQYSPEYDAFYCAAQKNHNAPPREADIYENVSIDVETFDIETLLYALLAGWNKVNEGPSIDKPEHDLEVLPTIKQIETPLEETKQKDTDDYTFEDILNSGLIYISPDE